MQWQFIPVRHLLAPERVPSAVAICTVALYLLAFYNQSIGSGIGICTWRNLLAYLTFNYNFFIMTNFLKQVLLRFINSYLLGRPVAISNPLFGRLITSKSVVSLFARLLCSLLAIYLYYLYVKQVYRVEPYFTVVSILCYVSLNPYRG